MESTNNNNNPKSQNSSGGESDGQIDIREIMAEIRARVASEVAENKSKPIEFKPKVVDPGGSTAKAGELVYSDQLRHLNLNHSIPKELDLSSIVSHRQGILGKVIVKFKRKLINLVWSGLQSHFRAEEEFRSNLVRHLNHTAKYVDQRDADNFWELIRKLDYDMNKIRERVEIFADSQEATRGDLEQKLGQQIKTHVETLQKHITENQTLAQQNNQQLATLDSVCRGLEGIVSKLTRKTEDSSFATNDIKQISKDTSDYTYVLLENRFRGSEEEIAKRLAVYPEIFKDVQKPVLEIGAGRGELQQLFKAEDIPSVAIDIDQAMVEACGEKGFDVKLEDAVDFLKAQEDKSLGGMIAVQVVEHLERPYLEEMLELAQEKLVSGSKIVFETINPQSLLALSSNYFRDPTHVWPQHPDTLRYQMELKGLKVTEVKYLSPVEGVLKTIPVDEQMPPRWQRTIDVLNSNLEQLNTLLYGHMDFAIIAEVR